MLPEERDAAGQTGKTKDLITDDYDLLRFYELRALRILIDASVVKSRPAAILGPSRNEIILKLAISNGLSETAIMSLHDRNEPLLRLPVFQQSAHHALVPKVRLPGFDLDAALHFLEGEREIAFKGEVEAKIEDFLH